MSSGIGDYIHYKYNNYKQYGLRTVRRADKSTYEVNPASVLSTAHENIYKQFQKFGSWNKANQLSTQLNYFYGGNGGQISSERLDSQVKDALEKAILTYLADYESRGLSLDMEHLKFDYQSGHSSIKEGIGKFRAGLNKKGEVGKKAQIEGLIKKVDLFIKKSDIITSKDGLSDKDFETLEKLRTNWESVRRQLKEMSKTRTIVNSDMAITGMGGNAYKTYGNFLQEFNSLLDNFRLGQAVYNGLLGEFIVPAILYAIENKGNEAINDLMIDFAKNYKSNKQGSLGSSGSYANIGAQSSQKMLDQLNFGVRIDTYIDIPGGAKSKYEGPFTYTQEADGSLVSVKATQDKVDAVINYNDIE